MDHPAHPHLSDGDILVLQIATTVILVGVTGILIQYLLLFSYLT